MRETLILFPENLTCNSGRRSIFLGNSAALLLSVHVHVDFATVVCYLNTLRLFIRNRLKVHCQMSCDLKVANESTHCQGKNSSFRLYMSLNFIVLYCSYLQVLILIVSLDLESLRKLIQEDR